MHTVDAIPVIHDNILATYAGRDDVSVVAGPKSKDGKPAYLDLNVPIWGNPSGWSLGRAERGSILYMILQDLTDDVCPRLSAEREGDAVRYRLSGTDTQHL